MDVLICFFSSILKHSRHFRMVLVAVWHFAGAIITFILAFLIRFDGVVTDQCWMQMWLALPVLLIIYVVMFSFFRLYTGMWRYFSVDDLVRMGLALLTSNLLFALVIYTLHLPVLQGFPRSVVVLEFLLMGFWMAGGTFTVRYARMRMCGNSDPGSVPLNERMVVAGHVANADIIVRSARADGMGSVVGIVTDEADKDGMTIHGVKIHSPLGRVAEVIKQTGAQCLLLLPPFNRPAHLNDIVAACVTAGVTCKFRKVPSMSALTSGQLTVSTIHDVNIEDLIQRNPVHLDRTEVRRFVKNKKVMITGAGGSIGSELCRQIAAYEPSKMVLFETSELALYKIDMELRRLYPSMKIVSYAGDIRYREEVEQAIDLADGIDIIYHAAAYKHVPLMEHNVSTCFRTNVLGTYRLAQVAIARNVDRFVMISSDKAVRPSSVMGATKRLAERIISEMPPSGTTFVSVRFGNVLESSGSVVPLFKQQIAQGGPVTVTSDEVRRFFMTAAEAVDLVLMAGIIGRNGDIMVLDMGESIRIMDLAKRLITLSGLTPGQDIKIVITGLRPGEKEYEEVMAEDEEVLQTPFPKILLFKKQGVGVSAPLNLSLVEEMVAGNDVKGLRALAVACIPENKFVREERL